MAAQLALFCPCYLDGSLRCVILLMRGHHFCLGKVSQGGRMTGATDGSMPVGSAEIIYLVF